MKPIHVEKEVQGAYEQYTIKKGCYGTVKDIVLVQEGVSGLTYNLTLNTVSGATVLFPEGIARALGYTDSRGVIRQLLKYCNASVTDRGKRVCVSQFQ